MMKNDELTRLAREAAQRQQKQQAQGRALLVWKLARHTRAGGDGDIEGLEFADLQHLTPAEYLKHREQVNRVIREDYEHKKQAKSETEGS